MFEYSLDNKLKQWLIEHAEVMDQQSGYAQQVLQRMVPESLFGLGVSEYLGGVSQSTFHDAFAARVTVAKSSLDATFILWAQLGDDRLLAQQPDDPVAHSLLTLPRV